MNATVGDGELIVHNYVNLGIAVDLNYEGLIVPVIHDAQDKRLRAIAREISDLAGRARTQEALGRRHHRRHLHHHQRRRSPARSSQLPVINQPQVMILSTEGVHRKPGRRHRRRRQRGHRHPLGRQPLDGAGTTGPSTAPTPPPSSAGSREILETRDWAAEL